MKASAGGCVGADAIASEPSMPKTDFMRAARRDCEAGFKHARAFLRASPGTTRVTPMHRATRGIAQHARTKKEVPDILVRKPERPGFLGHETRIDPVSAAPSWHVGVSFALRVFLPAPKL